METGNLDTASDYINSLLLARGLLRNGKPIEFAEPAAAADGADSTMARIINLIHDLVIRRDREAEQRENLASTVRTLRNDEAKQTHEIQRLETKTEELARSLAIAEGQERSFKTNIRSAEATIRGLKDQVQRMKLSIQQIRAQCATDIRKRDVEIQKLKVRLTERQRGKRDGLGVTTIMITPPTKSTSLDRKPTEGGEGLNNPGYSLRQETTEFLTQLCQSLSDENDSLIGLAQNSIETLKELQGLTDIQVDEAQEEQSCSDIGMDSLHGPLPPCEALSIQMSFVLDQLRTLLTNPSFVPLEEVEVRDNEISRLREGWEKMESRWREAVSMMDGWHKRMARGDGLIDIDELKLGLALGPTPEQSLGHQNGSIDDNDEDNGDTAEASTQEVNSAPFAKENNLKQPNNLSSEGTRPRRAARHDSRLETVLEERSGNERPRRSPGKSCPAGESVRSEEADSDKQVALDKSDLANTRRRRQPNTKITKPGTRASTRQTGAAKLGPKTHSAEAERRRSQGRKRSNSSRQSNPRIRRRRSTLSADELDS